MSTINSHRAQQISNAVYKRLVSERVAFQRQRRNEGMIKKNTRTGAASRYSLRSQCSNVAEHLYMITSFSLTPVHDSLHTFVGGSSRAFVLDSSHAVAYDFSHAFVHDSLHALIHDSSHTFAYDSSRSFVHDSSHAGSSTDVTLGSSDAICTGSRSLGEFFRAGWKVECTLT